MGSINLDYFIHAANILLLAPIASGTFCGCGSWRASSLAAIPYSSFSEHRCGQRLDGVS